jgi:hypothetical protein
MGASQTDEIACEFNEFVCPSLSKKKYRIRLSVSSMASFIFDHDVRRTLLTLLPRGYEYRFHVLVVYLMLESARC